MHAAIAGQPLKLKNWKAKRAGGRITVYGEDTTTGHQTKITGVDQIEPPPFPSDPFVYATDRFGVIHQLVLG